MLTSFINSTALIPRLNFKKNSINLALKNKNKNNKNNNFYNTPVNTVNFFDSNSEI